MMERFASALCLVLLEIKVYDEFISQAATRLDFDDRDYWIYWPDVLDPVARRKWTQNTDNIPARQRTRDRFLEEFNRFVTHYSNSASPRDDLIRYLLSDECKKPRKVTPDDHATRMETLCLYANRLEGLEADLTEERITMIIFNSFPEPGALETRFQDRSRSPRECN